MINWIKEKWNRFKKWIVGGIAVASVVAGGVVLQPDQIPLTLSVDGKETSVAYTDDNSGECLIINTDKEDYLNIGGNFNVIYSVTNKCGQDQIVKITFGLNDQYGNKKYTNDIFEYNGEKITLEQIPKLIWITSGTDPIISFETKEKITTEWKSIILEEFIRPTVIKDIKGTKEGKNISILIKNNETKFFKANIKYVDFREKEEFFVEAFGDKGGYGHLDPWVYEQLFNTLNTAALAGQDSWTNETGTAGASQVSTNASAIYEGAKGVQFTVNATNPDEKIDRTFAGITDGSVYFAMKQESDGSVGNFHYRIDDGADAGEEILIGFRAGNFIYYDLTTGYTTIEAIQANTWYVVNVEFDDVNQNDKYRYRYTKTTTWGSFSGWLTMEGGYTSMTRGYLIGWAVTGSTIYDFDTITPTDPTIVPAVAAEPDNYQTIWWTEE